MDTTAPFDDAQGKQNNQPAQPVVDDNTQQVTPTPTPVVTPAGKETSPTSNVAALQIEKPQEQWVEETAPKASVTEELEKAGVEATQGEVLEVPPDVAQAGVTSTGVATPVPTEPTVQFPMTEEKAKGILKMHKKVRDSVTWLAMLIMRQFQIMQNKKVS